MSHKLFSRARLTKDELSVVLRALKNVRELTFIQLCDELGIDRENEADLKSICSRNPVSETKRQPIICALDNISFSSAKVLAISLKAHYPELYSHIFVPSAPLSNLLSQWSSDYEMQAKFNNAHCGDRGRYYNLRLRNDGKIICAMMYISRSIPLHPLPRFLTFRPKTNERKRFVRGVIFNSNEKIYAFGKSTYGNGFRATILESVDLEGGRKDMFGVRVGLQENIRSRDDDMPYGYPIYCYQIPRKIGESGIRKAVGVHTVEDFQKMEHIANRNEILVFLQAAQRSQSGVSFSQARSHLKAY